MSLKVINLCCFLQLVLGCVTVNAIPGSVCHGFDSAVTYPTARRNESVIDDFHGTKVADPYRWLEDPDSDETKQFVNAENEISQSFLENCQEWQKINSQLTKVWNYAKFTVPRRYGKYYFSLMNTGLQNQNVLYKQSSLDDEASVFLDPNTLSSDGTVALGTTKFSNDGSFLAYELSESGSDWATIKVRSVETGKDYPEVLKRVKFSGISWTVDNKGFFYSRYPDGGDGSETDKYENHKLYYHRVGEPQEKDVLVVEFPENPSWQISGHVSQSEHGEYMILYVTDTGNDNLVYIGDLAKNGEITGKIKLIPIIPDFEASYEYIANIRSNMYFHTNKNAPNYRVIVIDLENPAEANWRTLIGEDPNDVLNRVLWVDEDKLLTIYLRDVKSVLQVHSLENGKLIRQFPLEIGDIPEISGSKSESEFFIQLKSFVTPGIIYRYDFTQPNDNLTVFREVKLNLKGFDKKDFTVEQVFYPSRDGTQIPMFIIQKKAQNKRPKPCLLYGYGGFSISMLPSFKPSWLFFMNSFDGVLAVANIRGGGEYGAKWHDAGRLLNKQNVFDDFQAAAKYLVDQKYTEQKKIAIQGGSNGGLLVGACVNQRPDLFGAAVAQVGVMDMLRYPRFTIGAAWISDYGNPQEKIHFENLYKYSPLHNVHSPNSTLNAYPPTLITTADHDDRVSPLHSLKLTATLQNTLKGNKYQTKPILLRVYSNAGHGGGKPTTKAIEGDTDVLTFLYRALGIATEI